MGTNPTKAAGNIYCQCRKEAAKYNDKLNSREGAAEVLGMSSSTLSDYELGITKIIPAENILRMADVYNAPQLKNHYCKNCCPQDGIPHQIVRTIIPKLTDTANSILGQMTGGKMGVEFKTEKTQKSNSKKEVVTLDIFINEYGKSSLPYLSKSGGEKVKASLSVILALAEIKSSTAGIQLGMLFIDEPPFLDADGIQAYCDALETIQSRYPDLKVMAITHDPTMKARFPQSVDVIKTDEGSMVIY